MSPKDAKYDRWWKPHTGSLPHTGMAAVLRTRWKEANPTQTNTQLPAVPCNHGTPLTVAVLSGQPSCRKVAVTQQQQKNSHRSLKVKKWSLSLQNCLLLRKDNVQIQKMLVVPLILHHSHINSTWAKVKWSPPWSAVWHQSMFWKGWKP